METESTKLQRFTKHPATIEIARFAAFAIATAGSKWLFGKAATAYRERKQTELSSGAESKQPRQPAPVQGQNVVGAS